MMDIANVKNIFLRKILEFKRFHKLQSQRHKAIKLNGFSLFLQILQISFEQNEITFLAEFEVVQTYFFMIKLRNPTSIIK